MALKRFKWLIDAPTTVNKVKGVEFTPDSKKGAGFRITNGIMSVPSLDALASGDKIVFQISTQNQNEAADVYSINSEYEVVTYPLEYVMLGTNGPGIWHPDPKTGIPIPKEIIDGITLKSGRKYYLNMLITGQDGAILSYVTLNGQYVNKGVYNDQHDGEK